METDRQIDRMARMHIKMRMTHRTPTIFQPK